MRKVQHFLSFGICLLFLLSLSYSSSFAQSYGPGYHTLTVPANATQVEITVRGADGGNFRNLGGTITSNGGGGASASGTFAVTGGESLMIVVGSTGSNGGRANPKVVDSKLNVVPFTPESAGGGGGGSGVFLNGTAIIAAGGGGGASSNQGGGNGTSGGGGGNGGSYGGNQGAGGGGGGLNGAGGGYNTEELVDDSSSGGEGGLGARSSQASSGGAGQNGSNGSGGSGFGGGGGGGESYFSEIGPIRGGGGGGGGYSGGNGGSATSGGGGSSFVASSAISGGTSAGGGGSSQDGSVTISFITGVPTGDLCPNDPNKTEPGACGCGNLETDSDGDGTPDCIDKCPTTQKGDPGTCGCFVPDADSDADGVPDCIDNCPLDPFKTNPGDCGCNSSERDTDNDGTPDCVDGCPNDPNKIAPGCNDCGTPDTDMDGDGFIDCEDSCPETFNPSQVFSLDCDCEAPAIIGITVSNKSECDDDRDVFTADVSITFTDPPVNGAIRIAGDINLGEKADRIDFQHGAKDVVYTLQGREFKADGKPIHILVEYIGNEGCALDQKNVGLAPEPCIELNTMPVVVRTREVANYCDLIMKDSGIYKLVTWINGDSVNTVKVQIVQTDADKSITILQNLQNANGKLEGFIQILNIDKTVSLGIENQRTTPKMKGRWSPPLRIDYQPAEGDDCIGIPPIKFIECNDNGTADPDDDYLIFDMTVIGEKDKIYELSGGISPSRGVFNTLSSFRTPLGTANGDLLEFEVTTSDDNTCTIMVELESPASCSGVCRITDISLTNFKRCRDQGTARPQDDVFMADVTVSFKNAPSSGFLNLDGLATFITEGRGQGFIEDFTNVSNLTSANSHVFRNVEIPEGADDYNIFASFSADDCEYELSEYYIPNVPCRVLQKCPPVDMLTVTLDEAAANTVHFDWNYIPNALLQEVEIRVDGLPWQTIANDSSEATIPALLPSTTYEYRVRYYCQENAWSEYVFGEFTTGESPLESNLIDPNTNGRVHNSVHILGVDKLTTNESFLNVFPNPVNEQLSIAYNFIDKAPPITLEVYDLFGRMVLHQKLNQTENITSLVVNQLTNGVYQLKVQSGQEFMSTKFIKN